MKSSIFNVVGDFFALDIGSSAIRVVQLRNSGNSHSLVKYGAAPIDVKLALSDAPADQKRVADVIAALVAEVGISTKNVVVGLPSNKTFVTLVDLPKMTLQELRSTIKYQADQYIPMSADEAKIDSVILGDSPADQTKMEVLLASVSNKFSEQRMEMLESIGLDVIALEPDSIAMARSLTPTGSANAQMVIDMGEYATDIVITSGGAPRLVRSIPTGGQSLLKAAMQNLNIDENQARQFVYKFGLDPSKLEGQVKRALISTVEVVSGEVQKSIKFFGGRYPSVALSGIVTSGAAVLLPGFHQYLSTAAGNIPVQGGNSWQNITYSNAAHEQLMNVNHQFAVAAGLAQRGGE
jgi:type IV pilus assembly protein PilM